MFSNFRIIFVLSLLSFLFSIDASKIISIKPGSLRGFYMFGICKYIRDNYDMSKFTFYGASAGAWNSLYLTKKMPDLKMESFLKSLDKNKFKTLYELEEKLKSYYLSNYVANDYNLDKLNICVSVLNNYRLEKQIFSDFTTLEDTLQCCIASSHIPYITRRSLYYPFRQYNCIDGGFFMNPHYDYQEPNIIIEPDMWKNEETAKYSSLFNMDNLDIPKLIEIGYEDARKHKEELDEALK